MHSCEASNAYICQVYKANSHEMIYNCQCYRVKTDILEGLSMYKGTNPSALRSQRLLAAALVELMSDYEYSKISISMLCARAGVSRQTFYKVFESKENIVCAVARSKSLDLELRLSEKETITLEELARHTFSFFSQNMALIRRLTDNNLQYVLQDQAQLALADLLKYYRCNDDVPLDASNRAFIAGGLCAMLTAWAAEENDASPELHAQHFAKLFAVHSFTRMLPAEHVAKKLAESYTGR